MSTDGEAPTPRTQLASTISKLALIDQGQVESYAAWFQKRVERCLKRSKVKGEQNRQRNSMLGPRLNLERRSSSLKRKAASFPVAGVEGSARQPQLSRDSRQPSSAHGEPSLHGPAPVQHTQRTNDEPDLTAPVQSVGAVRFAGSGNISISERNLSVSAADHGISISNGAPGVARDDGHQEPEVIIVKDNRVQWLLSPTTSSLDIHSSVSPTESYLVWAAEQEPAPSREVANGLGPESGDDNDDGVRCTKVAGLTRPDQVDQSISGGPICHNGDPHCNDSPGFMRQGEALIDGGTNAIPFFPSFSDNLGPQYRPLSGPLGSERYFLNPQRRTTSTQTSIPCGPDRQFDCEDKNDIFKTPSSSSKPKPELATDATTVRTPASSTDGVIELTPGTPQSDLESNYRPEITAQRPEVIEFMMTIPDAATVQTPPSSRIGVLEQIPETPQSDLQSNYKPEIISNAVESTGSSSSHRSISLTATKRSYSGTTSSSGSKRQRDDVGFNPEVIGSGFPRFIHISDSFTHAIGYNCNEQRMAALQHRLWRTRGDISTLTPRETLRIIRHWHFVLCLDNPACPIIAWHIFYRRLQTLQASTSITQQQQSEFRSRSRVLMATGLWVAAKLADTEHKIPVASRMARTAGVPAKSLISEELPLLDALQWNLVRPACLPFADFAAINHTHEH